MPDDAEFPYITYEVATANFENRIPLNASIWYHSTSWVACNAKAAEVAERLEMHKPCIISNVDGGKLWLMQGSPFSRCMTDPSDSDIKRNIISITAEFLTVR